MKTIRVPLSAYIICALLFSTAMAQGQSVKINSVSGTNFCAGDSISVTFTATGSWGHKNAFTMQLSDSSGRFTKFVNLGSINDTVACTFTIVSIASPRYGESSHYRIRIFGANPYTVSEDNGQDITIGVQPTVYLEIADFSTYETTSIGGLYLGVGAQVDSIVQILLSHGTGIDPYASSTIDWDFGSGANPPNASGLGLEENYVTYSTAGDKTVSVKLTGPTRCSTSSSIKYHVFDCTKPPIPKNALVDSAQNGNFNNQRGAIWVNPGVHLGFTGGNDTLFCESGSDIVNDGDHNVIYLKPGASYTEPRGGKYHTVIYADGVSLNFVNLNYRKLIHCPNLDFDYTNAPPNVAHPLDGIVNIPQPTLTISPNPTRGIISIHGAPSNDLNISVLNILGETVMQLKNPPAPDFTLDLSKLVSGTYYIRFSSANSVVTKMVVRE